MSILFSVDFLSCVDFSVDFISCVDFSVDFLFLPLTFYFFHWFSLSFDFLFLLIWTVFIPFPLTSFLVQILSLCFVASNEFVIPTMINLTLTTLFYLSWCHDSQITVGHRDPNPDDTHVSLLSVRSSINFLFSWFPLVLIPSCLSLFFSCVDLLFSWFSFFYTYI